MIDRHDKQAIEALRTEAHSLTLCGECKSATFILWRLESTSMGIGTDDIHRREERRGITSFDSEWIQDADDPEARAGVIVRCAFFRMNVPDPFSIVVCEGFKARRDHA